jgi:hemerythrin
VNEAIHPLQDAGDSGFYAVGYAPMIELNRHARHLLHALGAPEAADYGMALVTIHGHLLRQCATEEDWMRAADFPGYERHKREHDMLLEVISEVRRRYDAGDTEIVERLARELPQWFDDHANSMDAALAYFLKDRAAPPVGELEAELA